MSACVDDIYQMEHVVSSVKKNQNRPFLFSQK